MMDVTSIQSGIQAAAGGSAQTGRGQSMGKDDFLRLLVTQLKNQDPLNPTDPTEMTSQLAQYSSLEQLYNINDSLQGLGEVTSASQQATALSLLGKDVEVNRNTLELGQNPVKLGYSLERPASEVQILVQDLGGNTVKVLDGESGSIDRHFVTWDGTDENGRDVPPGRYSFVVAAKDSEGNVFSSQPMLSAAVQGVDYDSSGQTLQTSAGPVGMTDIVRVTN